MSDKSNLTERVGAKDHVKSEAKRLRLNSVLAIKRMSLIAIAMITMNFIVPNVMACIPIESITFSTGGLYPGFEWKISTYDLYVVDTAENTTMTIHLSKDSPQCYTGYSINEGAITNPDENENVTFDLILQPNENSVLVLRCHWGEDNKFDTYTFTIIRYGCSTAGYIFNFVNHYEIATGTTSLTFTDPVTNTDVTVYLIDRCQLEYVVIAGNLSDNLLLQFKETNGSKVSNVNITNKGSIYNIKVNFGIAYGQVNPPYQMTTHFQYGRPWYTDLIYGDFFVVKVFYTQAGQINRITVVYERHSNDVIVSRNSEILSTYDINHPGSILYMNASDLIIEKFCPQNIIESPANSAISVYPNPANNSFFIECENITAIKLYDMFGREVLTQPANANTEVNISHLPKGVYGIRILSGDSVIGNSKIVKY